MIHKYNWITRVKLKKNNEKVKNAPPAEFSRFARIVFLRESSRNLFSTRSARTTEATISRRHNIRYVIVSLLPPTTMVSTTEKKIPPEIASARIAFRSTAQSGVPSEERTQKTENNRVGRWRMKINKNKSTPHYFYPQSPRKPACISKWQNNSRRKPCRIPRHLSW